jgi:hypothetical protein
MNTLNFKLQTSEKLQTSNFKLQVFVDLVIVTYLNFDTWTLNFSQRNVHG